MITLDKVSKWYNPQFQVLKNCTTQVEKGEVVVVCGPSGSGKSTLIKTVNALEPVQEGTITVDGLDVTKMKKELPKLRSASARPSCSAARKRQHARKPWPCWSVSA
jgi:glutamate/aspartate transport system ATP-binding protein